MTAITAPFAARLDSKAGRRLLLLIGGVVAVLLYLLFKGQGTLPHDDELSAVPDAQRRPRLGRGEPRLARRVRRHPRGDRGARRRDSTRCSPPSAGRACWRSPAGSGSSSVAGGWRSSPPLGFAALGVLGLWESAHGHARPDARGGPDLAAGRDPARDHRRPDSRASRRRSRRSSTRCRSCRPSRTSRPMTLLFGIGVAPGTIATLIYAIPPAVRITALGIRGVPTATMEAAESLGSTRWQTLSQGPAAARPADDRHRRQPDDHDGPLDGRDHRAHRRAGPRRRRPARAPAGQCRSRIPGRARDRDPGHRPGPPDRPRRRVDRSALPACRRDPSPAADRRRDRGRRPS